MRHLIGVEFVSLDGGVQAPGGTDEDPSGGLAHGGWIRRYADPVQSALIRRQWTKHAWQPSVFLSGDVAGRVAALEEQPGPNLHVYGSANLVQTLLANDLVDALWLRVHPITLGAGKRLFAGGAIPSGRA